MSVEGQTENKLKKIKAIGFAALVVLGLAVFCQRENDQGSRPIPTVTVIPQKLPFSQLRCVTIGPEVPTAWRAWDNLGRPPEVYFFNEAGPDAQPGKPTELKSPFQLPRIVHKGDKFCLPKK